MFSGIVEEIGRVHKVHHLPDKVNLIIESNTSLKDLKLGDSIAVNGVCLTVCHLNSLYFAVELMPETLRVSTMSYLQAGNKVNLELALKLNSRLGGHYIQGHIDESTSISHIESDGCALKIWLNQHPSWRDYLIPKGFIAIDGVSLTLVDVTESHFSVCLIPHTQTFTIAHTYQVNTKVNIEIDHLTKIAVHVIKSLTERISHGQH